MVLASVAPEPRAHDTITTKANLTRSRSKSKSASIVLKDAPVSPLGAIDTSKTLVATLCGYSNDPAFHARVIRFTRQLEPLMHVVGVVFFVAGLSLAFVVDAQTRMVVSYTTAALGLCLWLYMAASLSWDMMRLVVQTFEFWFLFLVNLANVMLFVHMYHDERGIAFCVTGANFAMTLCTDANIYTRHFMTRLKGLASPGLFIVLIVTSLRLAPDLRYPQYQLAGLTVDAVDLLLNGNLIIAYFTVIRAYWSQHLVFSIAADRV